MKKPPVRLETTTLWEYPSQHYGDGVQGDPHFVGATPSYVIWNVISRYSQEGDLIVDPFCGSGTTLDVARDLKREAKGFDVAPTRKEITKADARSLPLPDGAAAVVFMDPPYGDHINYSNEPKCIGKLSAYEPAYYEAMSESIAEAHRVLRDGGVFALYVCDYFEKKKGFAPVGLQLLARVADYFELVDVVSVVRHNKSLGMGNFHKAADEQGFFLRGFNYLFLARKRTPVARSPGVDRSRRSRR